MEEPHAKSKCEVLCRHAEVVTNAEANEATLASPKKKKTRDGGELPRAEAERLRRVSGEGRIDRQLGPRSRDASGWGGRGGTTGEVEAASSR